MNDSTRRRLLGVEIVPHLGIRHSKYPRGPSGEWLVQFPTDAARAKFHLPPNRPYVRGVNQAKRERAQRLAHRRRFSQLDRVLPRDE